MELDSRKLRILQAIIDEYIQNGEPVGSTTIVQKYDLGLSSATIRNEMAELEELGLIKQPHISAGRIPSDRGYRIYVDDLMEDYKLSDKESKGIQDRLNKKAIGMDDLMNSIADVIAELTNYTSIATAPKMQMHIVKYIHVLPISAKRILLVIVTDTGKAKEILLNVQTNVSPEVLYTISNFLNDKFCNRVLEDVLLEIDNILVNNTITERQIIEYVFGVLKEQTNLFEKTEIFYGGTSNIFNFPEFSNIEKAKSFFELLNNEEILEDIFDNKFDGDIKILIGSEHENEKINDYSLVRKRYKFNNNVVGQIGIIGPTRMNYSKVVAYIDCITKELEKLLGM